jgi:hypothetical protein
LPIALPSAQPEAVHDDPRNRPWGADERFRVHVEQDGRERFIDGHRVTLARRPFTLAFELKTIDFVELNASFSSHTLELARTRASLAELEDAFGMGHGAAEEVDNPSRWMFVNDESFNYWGWDERIHRCHVHEKRGALMVCKRIVERFGPDPSAAVEQSTVPAVYIVVMATAIGEDSTQQELARDWLTVDFTEKR